MTKRYTLAVAISLPLLTGCDLAQTVADAEPTISDDGAILTAAPLSDLDSKISQATANTTIFPDAAIVFRRANSAEAIRSTAAIDIEPDCATNGTIRTCSATIAPSAIEEGEPVLSIGQRVYYQWLMEYGEAGGVAEGPVRSFTVAAAPSCSFSDIGQGLGAGDCSPERICSSVSVSLLGTPGLETVPRCYIPAP